MYKQIPVLLVCVLVIASVLGATPQPLNATSSFFLGQGKANAFIGPICGLVLGMALGLHAGSLLFAILGHWEGAANAVKTYSSAVAIFLPAAGGTLLWWLDGRLAVALYVLGLGSGLIVAYFWPKGPSGLTLRDATYIVFLSEDLRDDVADVQKRAVLILNALRTPEGIARQENISVNELAEELENATDAYGRKNSHGSDHEGSNPSAPG